MTYHIDIRVAELLCSRLCHDLVSPVGAVNNGVELIEEMGEDIRDEAIGLIAHSAAQAWRRLRLFRIAYGAAGADGLIGYGEIRQAAEAFLEGGKISLAWDSSMDQAEETAGSAKVLLNLIVLAQESLPYGGVIHIYADGLPAVAASGRQAVVGDEALAALAGSVAVDALSARNVHPYVTGRFADRFGFKLDLRQQGAERFDIALRAKAMAA